MTTLTYNFAAALLVGLSLATGDGEDGKQPIVALSAAGDPHLVEGSFRLNRGPQPVLWIPPAEVLEFRVEVDLGFLGEAVVGTVTLSSRVEPFVSGLPLPGDTSAGSGQMVGWISSVARGGHLGYELDHSLTTRFLPQDWPSVLSLEVQSGSRNRKKELKIGRKDGQWTGSYRGDHHCQGCGRREHYIKPTIPWNDDYHCKKCKRGEHREWSDPLVREIPPETIDMLGAIYLARTLVREGLEALEFPMLQKDHLWTVKLSAGVRARIKTPAGTFPCREVLLSVSQPEGEEAGSQRFSGLFGIKGAIKIWFQESTGVPVLIEGDVPIGSLLNLHVRVKLKGFEGTPEAFTSP